MRPETWQMFSVHEPGECRAVAANLEDLLKVPALAHVLAAKGVVLRCRFESRHVFLISPGLADLLQPILETYKGEPCASPEIGSASVDVLLTDDEPGWLSLDAALVRASQSAVSLLKEVVPSNDGHYAQPSDGALGAIGSSSG